MNIKDMVDRLERVRDAGGEYGHKYRYTDYTRTEFDKIIAALRAAEEMRITGDCQAWDAVCGSEVPNDD